MNILGLNSVIVDSAASLLQEGRIVAALEEERFSRLKHDGAFPISAIQKCFELGNIKPCHIDVVCSSFDVWKAAFFRFRHALGNKPSAFINFAANRKKEFLKVISIEQTLRRLLPLRKNVKFLAVDHHLSHAASTFFVSPFDEAAILVMDSSGEDTSVSFFLGKNNKIAKVGQFPYGHSLGAFYTSITEYLGFRPNSGEGKVMGLAAYGEPEYMDFFSKIVFLEKNGECRLDLSYFTHQTGLGVHCSKKFINELGPPRLPQSPITQRDKNIAASLQKILEDAAVHIASHFQKKTQQRNLCLAGGVALNSVMNGLLLERSGFDDIYLIPSPGDSGTSLGAALYYQHSVFGHPRRDVLRTPFLGMSYDEDVVAEAVKKCDEIEGEKREDFVDATAKLLSCGYIVGWFQGKFEFGPRALGHRSILADPRRKDIKDVLNARVKFREPFRPFAPAVLYEKRGEIFSNAHDNPFMLFVFKIREDIRHLIPGVVHVDNTGRGQTVAKDASPEFWQLINTFYNRTGIPVLLNTSFNVRGEPIVDTPSQAIECFLKTDMDYLCLNNYLVWKKNRGRPKELHD